MMGRFLNFKKQCQNRVLVITVLTLCVCQLKGYSFQLNSYIALKIKASLFYALLGLCFVVFDKFIFIQVLS